MKNKILVLSIVILLIVSLISCENNVKPLNYHSSLESQTNFDSEFFVSDTMSADELLPEQIPEPQDTIVSFLAVGDNIIYNGQLREAKANAKDDPNVEYDFKSMYSNVAEIIDSYDVAFVNQETVMAGKSYGYSQYPDFNSPQELGYDLLSIGFDIVNIATNHMLDMWYDGLEKTIRFWEGMDALMVGGYWDKDDFMDIRYIEREGVKIAVVGFTYSPKYKEGKNVFIPQINDDLITEWLEKAREEADFIVVSMHWGKEYDQSPSSEQKRLAKLIADNGADVILGHHTHCLQPIEWIEGQDGNRTLCFYSLGNFTSETDETVSLVGGIATFDIVYNELDGARIDNIGFIPTVMDYRSSFNKNTVYLLQDYTNELCKSHNIVSYFKKPLDLDMLNGYVMNVIDEQYLPLSYLNSISKAEN